MIYADLETVKNAFLNSLNGYFTVVETHYGIFEIHLEEPIPYNHPITKVVLWQPPDSPGTVLYGNQYDGFHSLGSVLNDDYHLEMTRIAISMDIDAPDSDSYLFCKFEHNFSDGRERYVRVMWDDRWDFYEKGEPMPFEQTENYTQRIRRKRLTNEMVLDYAKALGWDLRDPSFWTSKKEAWYLTYTYLTNPDKK